MRKIYIKKQLKNIKYRKSHSIDTIYRMDIIEDLEKSSSYLEEPTTILKGSDIRYKESQVRERKL